MGHKEAGMVEYTEQGVVFTKLKIGKPMFVKSRKMLIPIHEIGKAYPYPVIDVELGKCMNKECVRFNQAEVIVADRQVDPETEIDRVCSECGGSLSWVVNKVPAGNVYVTEEEVIDGHM